MPSQFLIVAHYQDIRIVSLDVNFTVDVVLPVSNLKNTSGVDFDKHTGHVYYTDPGRDVINRTDLSGKKVETIIDTELDTADSLVVDSTGGKVGECFITSKHTVRSAIV